MRQSIRTSLPRAAALLAVGGLLLLSPRPAVAQEARRAMDAQIFRPAMDNRGIFTVERADLGKSLEWGFRFALHGGPSPVHLRLSGLDANGSSAPFDYSVTINLGFHVTFTKWLELGVDVPFNAQGFGDAYDHEEPGSFLFHDPASNLNRKPQRVVAADPRVGLKVGIPLGKKAGGFGLAVATFLTVPFGDEATFSGDRGFTVEPRLIAAYTGKRFTAAVNLGYLWRLKQQVFDPALTGAGALQLELDDELTWGVGAKVTLTKFLDFGVEVHGRGPIQASSDHKDLPVEVLAGLGFRFGRVSWSVGGGVNIANFVSQHGLKPFGRAGQFRIFTMLGYVPGATKTVVETKDTDKDGIPDHLDRCPTQPEDKDGYEDDDGCPDPDNDSDGIPDVRDKCPDKPEDFDKFQDGDGCPETDNDGDGIPDSRDKCPDEPEDKNNVDDDDGCPESGGGSGLTGGKIDLQGKRVEFKPGSAELLPSSKPLLDRVANVIRNNPKIRLIRIEGHTDNQGNAQTNLSLSRLRARAVLRYLVGRGVARSRLAAVGYGQTRPIKPNNSNQNRALNRRVEFINVYGETK